MKYRTAILLIGYLSTVSCTTLFTKPTTSVPTVSAPELVEEITAQVRDEFSRQVKENQRVQRIADRLLLASADLCGQTKEDYGFYWIDASVLNRMAPIDQAILLDYHDLSYHDFDEQNPFPFVSAIRERSGAEDGGIEKGDRIVRFNDQSAEPLYEGHQTGENRFGYVAKKGEWVGTLPLAVSSSLKEGSNPIPVEVLRRIPDLSDDTSDTRQSHKQAYKDTLLKLSISPKKVCDHRVTVITSGGKNAYTDGESIGITTGFLSSLNDEELAFIISHELAHIIEGHISKKRGNQFIGSLFGATLDALAEGLGTHTYRRYEYQMAQLGQKAFSQEFEAEADYIGLYILARAGYSTEEVANFWQRMAREMPMESNSLVGTHPPTAYRYLMLSKAHAEIEKKKVSGEVLLPERLGTSEKPKTRRPRGAYEPRNR